MAVILKVFLDQWIHFASSNLLVLRLLGRGPITLDKSMSLKEVSKTEKCPFTELKGKNNIAFDKKPNKVTSL